MIILYVFLILVYIVFISGDCKTRNETETKRDTTETKQDKAETKRNETRHNRNETKQKKSMNEKTKQTITKRFFFTRDNNPQNASGGLKNL